MATFGLIRSERVIALRAMPRILPIRGYRQRYSIAEEPASRERFKAPGSEAVQANGTVPLENAAGRRASDVALAAFRKMPAG